jgi:hypothetical protein
MIQYGGFVKSRKTNNYGSFNTILVGGLEHGGIFHMLGIIIPTGLSYFFEG